MKKFILAIFILSNVFLINPIEKALALDTSKTNFLNNAYYNKLIEDNDFISTKSMSVADIQNFLINKGSFLRDYSEGGRSAAQIIYDAANGISAGSRGSLNGIVVDQNTGTVNPMVILITLQKEQSLITTPTFSQSKLDCAMGFEGGNGCAWMYENRPGWKGFTNQVDTGAWQLRYNFYRSEPERTTLPNFKVGETRILANTGYANISVTFQNKSTASLYRYTPHVFNGNYNFWKYFNDWFGSSHIPAPGTIALSPVTMSTYSSKLLIGSACTMNVDPPIGKTTYNVPCPGGGTHQITIIRHKPADINGDAKVDLMDLSLFATYWNKTKPAVQLANLNPDVDEEVNLLDLSILAANWNK
jgi:hypothetical protein